MAHIHHKNKNKTRTDAVAGAGPEQGLHSQRPPFHSGTVVTPCLVSGHNTHRAVRAISRCPLSMRSVPGTGPGGRRAGCDLWAGCLPRAWIRVRKPGTRRNRRRGQGSEGIALYTFWHVLIFFEPCIYVDGLFTKIKLIRKKGT